VDIESAFNTPATPESALGWYQSRMKASGITESIAKKCGLTLEFGDDNTYFNIPYFTIDGVATTHRRQRNREEQIVREKGQSSGNFLGKYTQKKGSKNHVYWPPVINQRLAFNNPSCPLLICEGELKAISGFMAAISNAIPMLVAGIPGTKLCDTVIDELRAVNCIGPEARRIVYIASDWNGKGSSRENSAQLDYDLKKLFQGLGAEVIMLRWPLAEGQEKVEQKLDDWLVAGGDLSMAIRMSKEEVDSIATEFSEMWDYFNSNYAICHGNYVPLRDHTKKYATQHFHIMEASKVIQVSKNRTLSPSEVWGRQKPEDRNVVDGYTFYPAPLGQEPERYVWEEGKRMLNTAPEGVTIPPWEVGDAAPFVALVERLAQENGGWLLDYLAHTAQRPRDRGQHIVIFRDEGGTGKSCLFDTLDLVFGRYSGPVGSAMTSSFNAGLEHLLLPHWSDPVIHGAVDRDLESALKNFSGDSKIEINHKGGAKYHVRNYGRLMIATNKDWIVPIGKGERRYAVFGGLSAWPYSEWDEYDKWLKSGGVEAIRCFLVERDISGFEISAPAPRTEQRGTMEKASLPPLVALLEDDYFLDRDIYTIDQIRMQYKEQTGRTLSSVAIGMQIAKFGAIMRVVKVNGKATRLWAVRRCPYWDALESKDWVAGFEARF